MYSKVNTSLPSFAQASSKALGLMSILFLKRALKIYALIHTETGSSSAARDLEFSLSYEYAQLLLIYVPHLICSLYLVSPSALTLHLLFSHSKFHPFFNTKTISLFTRLI